MNRDVGIGSPAALRMLLAATVSLVIVIGCGRGLEKPGDAETLREQFPAHAAAVFAHDADFVADGGFFARRAPRPTGVSLHLPFEASEALRFSFADGVRFDVRELGVEGRGALVNGTVSYRRASGRSYWSSIPEGLEEWLIVPPEAVGRGAPIAAWQIRAGSLVESDGGIDVIDADRKHRLRLSAPAAYGTGERQVFTRLVVRGERVELWADAESEPLLIDPVWTTTPPLPGARYSHTTTVLEDGRVLVVGGFNGGALATAQIFDPITNAWAAAPPLSHARSGHTATLLADHRVLVAGGSNGTASIATTEIYDPGAGTWTPGPSLVHR